MLFDVDNLYAGARQAQIEGRTCEAADLYLKAAVLVEATDRSLWADAVFTRALAAENAYLRVAT